MRRQTVTGLVSVGPKTALALVDIICSISLFVRYLCTGNLCEHECDTDKDCKDYHCNTALGYTCRYGIVTLK